MLSTYQRDVLFIVCVCFFGGGKDWGGGVELWVCCVQSVETEILGYLELYSTLFLGGCFFFFQCCLKE